MNCGGGAGHAAAAEDAGVVEDRLVEPIALAREALAHARLQVLKTLLARLGRFPERVRLAALEQAELSFQVLNLAVQPRDHPAGPGRALLPRPHGAGRLPS